MKVKIKGDGHGSNTGIVNVETGERIAGVIRLDFDATAGLSTKATLYLELVPIDAMADAHFMMMHPKSGKMKRVASISFEDGETVTL